VLRVTKRDGTQEDFDVAKLRACLARALQACGYPSRLAAPLAAAITDYLARRPPEPSPTTDSVYRYACTVLGKTGFGEAVAWLNVNRRRRAVLRRNVSVFDALQPQQCSTRWSRAVLVGGLRRQHQLLPSVARFLAGRIEQHVLDLGMRLVSTTFIAELARKELSAWGLSEAALTVHSVAACSDRIPHPPNEKNV